MAKIYCVAGLGADYRLFKNLELPGHDINYCYWLEPENTDTLASYASKLINTYNIRSGVVVIGNSLGGVLAIEIAKQVQPIKTIVISSIKSSEEEPWYFKVFKKVPLYTIIPARLMTKVSFGIKWVFGNMSAEDETIFKSMLTNSSPKFMKWAMGAILKWHSTAVPPNVYHITGDSDRVFDYRRIRGATLVKGGTHIMMFDRTKEVSKWVMEVLSK